MDAKIVGVFVVAAVVGGAAGCAVARLPDTRPEVAVGVACVLFVAVGFASRATIVRAVAEDDEVRAHLGVISRIPAQGR